MRSIPQEATRKEVWVHTGNLLVPGLSVPEQIDPEQVNVTVSLPLALFFFFLA